MAELFPDNAGVREALVQWHLRSGDPAGAEAVLRAAAARDPADPQAALTVVQFLLETAGPGRRPGRARPADRRGAADPRPFQRAPRRARLRRRPHRRRRSPPCAGWSTAPSPRTRPATCRSRSPRCWPRPARRRRARRCSRRCSTPTAAHVAALKLRAKLAIDADRPEAAIQDMRAALTEAPRDPEIMTIMALAHEREGSRELAGERLALAVEASDRAPDELAALRPLPDAGRPHRPGRGGGRRRAAPRAGGPRPARDARPDPSRAPRLGPRRPGGGAPARPGRPGRGRRAPTRSRWRASRPRAAPRDAIALLEGLAGGGADAAAMAGLVRAQVAAGDIAAAQAYLDGVLRRRPGQPAGAAAAGGAPRGAGRGGERPRRSTAR